MERKPQCRNAVWNGHAGEVLPLNAEFPMVVTLLPMVTLVRLLMAKAAGPMVVTLSGMVTLVRVLM